jgi:hypothetical protein
MNKWQIASAVSTIVQGVVVIVSLIFIWRQIQLQTKQISLQTELAKAANRQAKEHVSQVMQELQNEQA